MSHTYKKNYLKQVIFRLDFESTELTNFEEYRQLAGDLFDDISKKKGKVGNFEFQVDSGEVINSVEEIDVWHFLNTTNGNRLEIGPSYLVLEYFSYKDSSAIKDYISKMCIKFLNDHSVKQLIRMGLRYINNLEFDSVRKLQDWKAYISSDLLVVHEFIGSKDRVPLRILNQFEYKTDSCSAIFKYGIWNDKYPSPILRSSYILDIDCYTPRPVDTDLDAILKSFTDLKDEAESIFELSITDKVRKEMEK